MSDTFMTFTDLHSFPGQKLTAFAFSLKRDHVMLMKKMMEMMMDMTLRYFFVFVVDVLV